MSLIEQLAALAEKWEARSQYGGCCCDDMARDCAEELKALLSPQPDLK